MRSVAALFGIHMLVLGSETGAQATTPEPASIPIELARAMVGSPFGESEGRTRFFVGAPPGGLPSAIAIPEGARIVGGRISESGVTAVLAMNGQASIALDSITARMTRAGWKMPPMEPRPGFVQYGPRGAGAWLCSDSAVVMANPAGRGTNANYLTVTHRRRERFDACEPRAQDGRFEPDLEIPALQPPPGVRSMGGGGGGGGRDIHSATRLETTLDPTALLAHYAPQLRAAGWTVGATIGAADAAVAVAEARDSRGQQWRGILSALAWSNEPLRRVELRMSRPDPR